MLFKPNTPKPFPGFSPSPSPTCSSQQLNSRSLLCSRLISWGDLLSLLLLSRAASHPIRQQVLSAPPPRANEESSHFPSPSPGILTWILAVASYMDFLPSLCSPPTCSHHSSAPKPSKSPSQRKSQSLTVPAGSTHLSQQHLTLMHLASSSLLAPPSPVMPDSLLRCLPGPLQP